MEVKQHLSTLRRKLEEAAGRPAPIETRRGFGYRYVTPGGRAGTS
jgi:DNA-binding response OmpR family regulator